MARRKIKLPSFNAVDAGQVATVDLPIGPRYHGIKIFYKNNADQATIQADIKMVRIKVNGNVQRVFTPAELYKMLAENGKSFTAGILPIYFSEPWRRNVLSEDTLAWATATGVSSFQIEIELAAGANAPTLHAYASVDNVQGALQNIIKYRRQTIPNQQVGTLTVNTLSKKLGEQYHRMHCFETAAGDITGVNVKLDSREVYNADKAANTAFLADQEIIAQDGLFSIIFDETQRSEDSLPLHDASGRSVSDFEVNWQMAAANAFTLLTEVRGNPD